MGEKILFGIMLNKVEQTLDQFFKFNPWVNFIYFIGVICITMFTLNPYYIGASLVTGVLYLTFLKGKKALFEIRMSLIIIVVSAIGNALITHNGKSVLFYINNNRVTVEAFVRGLIIGLMIAAVVVWFSIVTVMFDSERFMSLFAKVMPKMSLLISMIIRYIPFLQERYNQIDEATKGLKKDKEGFFDKVEQGASKFSILVSWSLEDSIDTGDSMESRGYGLQGRTTIRKIRWKKNSIIRLIIIIMLFVLSVLGITNESAAVLYYPSIVIPSFDLEAWMEYVAFLILLLEPFIIKLLGDIRWKYLMSRI